MGRTVFSTWVLTLLLSLISCPLLAQTAEDTTESSDEEELLLPQPPPEPLRRGVNEWGIWGAISIKSRTPIGNTIYRTTWLAGIRYGRVVGTMWHTAFEYTFDFVPLELVLNDPSGPPDESGVERVHNVYGFGIWPAGIKFILGEGCNIKPFVGINSGLVLFKEAVPWEGRRANIAGNLDAGVHFMMGENRALTIAYKYHHVSNAYTAERNVGTNVNMVMVGYSWFK